MITIADYWMGRDKLYPKALNPQILAAAPITVARANLLLDAFHAVFPTAAPRHVNSGWRPPEINATTPRASRTSLHMSGQAIDISDDDGSLDRWCTSPAGLAALERIGLWLESPESTAGWCHVQTIPPRSGNRVFRP